MIQARSGIIRLASDLYHIQRASSPFYRYGNGVEAQVRETVTQTLVIQGSRGGSWEWV
jgi:hypothetical protein